MMMHVQKDWFSSKLLLVVANLCNLRYCANKFVCTLLTDLLTQFCWKLICMYILRWFMSERVIFSKNSIGSCKFMQLAIFLRINLWARLRLVFQPDCAENWYTCTPSEQQSTDFVQMYACWCRLWRVTIYQLEMITSLITTLTRLFQCDKSAYKTCIICNDLIVMNPRLWVRSDLYTNISHQYHYWIIV